ncbi:unnamed protein product [Ostreobium quekettii]|uniref:Uncharacterized protein n=1 Tax=Ostreobium quekettii TaxID=121088 RepID=A0A8S1IN96_9CHLO|nr:unnamed protein product [Ostreobium quekettii]|eukprot:evm.model.scf_15EXC.8 EVM.evm.TU.scf_15EXC.8   scf_15EXC:133295-138811(+)
MSSRRSSRLKLSHRKASRDRAEGRCEDDLTRVEQRRINRAIMQSLENAPPGTVMAMGLAEGPGEAVVHGSEAQGDCEMLPDELQAATEGKPCMVAEPVPLPNSAAKNTEPATNVHHGSVATDKPKKSGVACNEMADDRGGNLATDVPVRQASRLPSSRAKKIVRQSLAEQSDGSSMSSPVLKAKENVEGSDFRPSSESSSSESGDDCDDEDDEDFDAEEETPKKRKSQKKSVSMGPSGGKKAPKSVAVSKQGAKSGARKSAANMKRDTSTSRPSKPVRNSVQPARAAALPKSKGRSSCRGLPVASPSLGGIKPRQMASMEGGTAAPKEMGPNCNTGVETASRKPTACSPLRQLNGMAAPHREPGATTPLAGAVSL